MPIYTPALSSKRIPSPRARQGISKPKTTLHRRAPLSTISNTMRALEEPVLLQKKA
jgi:hypothetical protein